MSSSFIKYLIYAYYPALSWIVGVYLHILLLFTPFTATRFAMQRLQVKLRGIWSVNSNYILTVLSIFFCLA